MSVISGVLPIAFVSAVLCEPPLATTFVWLSILKVQSFLALSVMVRLSAATVLTVPFAVIVVSAAFAGAANRATTARAAAKRNIRILPGVSELSGNPSRSDRLLSRDGA